MSAGEEVGVEQPTDRLVGVLFDLLARDLQRNLKLLNDDIYKKQLPTIISDIDGKSRFKIESKETYKARTGESSPDDSDSLALANFARYFALKPLSISDALNAMKKAQETKGKPMPLNFMTPA